MSFTKLKGAENYTTWKFAMEMLLKREKLWKVTVNPGDNPNPYDVDKAIGTIGLAVEQHVYSLISGKVSAKDMWIALQNEYEDKGLMRRISLRHTLYGTKLSACKDMNDYIDKVLSIAQQLASVGAQVDEEEVAMVMLQNLTPEFDFLVVALESNDTKLTTEIVRAKLLPFQERIPVETIAEDSALITKGTKIKKHKFKCFLCHKIGHKASDCRMKNSSGTQKRRDKPNESALNVADKHKNYCWYIDSGATRHFSCNQHWFNSLTPCVPTTVTGIGNKVLTASQVGTIIVRLRIGGEIVVTDIQDVLFVPDLGSNLIAISLLEEKGYRVQFAKGRCMVLNERGTVIASATQCNQLYVLDTEECSAMAASDESKSMELWHKRLGHLGYDNVQKLIDGMVTGITVSNAERPVCESCIKGKQTRNPFPKSVSRAETPLALVHTDVCGPMEVESISGYRYFITLIDDATRMTHVYFIIEKSEVVSKIVEYKNLAETQMGLKLKILRSDNGGEYDNRMLAALLRKHGIKHQLSIAYTPEQNGMSERANRTIVERAQTMLSDAGLEKRFLAEAVSTAVYLKNRAPTVAVKGKTPLEAWSGKKPNLSHLRVFGSKAFAHVPKEKRRKLDPKSIQCIMLGYCEESKGYRLWDGKNKRLLKSRDVVFQETAPLTEAVEQKENVLLDVQAAESVSETETVTVDNQSGNRSSMRSNKGVPAKRYSEEYANIADKSTKMTKTMSPSSQGEIEEMRDIPYQSAVGSLMYASIGTRPDITHAVSRASQFAIDPGRQHWIAVKRILRYLKGTSSLKLKFSKSENSNLKVFCDADRGSDEDDQCSYTGYLFALAGAAVGWASRKQPTVALSTTEAEYMALTETSKEAMCIKETVCELGLLYQSETINIACDNKGAIDLSCSTKHHGRSKHIAIRHHFIRELVENKSISVEDIASEKNVADMLTKGLSTHLLIAFLKECGLKCD